MGPNYIKTHGSIYGPEAIPLNNNFYTDSKNVRIETSGYTQRPNRVAVCDVERTYKCRSTHDIRLFLLHRPLFYASWYTLFLKNECELFHK